MEMERRMAILALLLLFVLAACNGQPTPLTGEGNVDLSDPNVGGGVGIVLPDETPAPLPQPTRETAPRATTDPLTLGAPTVAVPAATPRPSPTAVAPELTVAPAETTTRPETAEPDPAADTTSDRGDEDAPPAAIALATPERPLTHTVAAGENLYRIGLQYGLSYIVLAEYNGITNFDQITVGQELSLPPADETDELAEAATATPLATATATPEPTTIAEPPGDATAAATSTAATTISATPSAGRTHTVLPGENLYRISQQVGISWVLIAEANGLISPNQITVGQVLKIPTDAPGPAPQFTHQVHAGESLFRIALQYGVPLSALVEANSLQAPYVIYPGQVLVIPGQGE